MSREDIIRMAREASGTDDIVLTTYGDLHHFAALVAAASEAKEREACAKVCDDMVLYTGFDCAAAIRARGQA